jgi:hypothetical protein
MERLDITMLPESRRVPYPIDAAGGFHLRRCAGTPMAV